MKYGKLLVAKNELPLINKLLRQPVAMRDIHYSKSLTKLAEELESAECLDQENMPDTVIRLNSFVTITTAENNCKTFQLVLPEKSNITADRLSILTPMGLALFGYAEGDEIVWDFPSGTKTIRITGVRQTKAENN